MGVWSGGKKRWLGQRGMCWSVVWWGKAMFGSKGKLWECGLTRKNAARVKGKGIEVWSGGKKRWLGQRESPRSVVWWEKSPPGSKRKPPECGLAREKSPPGSKGKASECGLVGKSDVWVKGKGIEVWSDKKNRRLGQRESHRSVAWQGKTAAWVKETPPLKARQ